jgi:hypothetical protein
MRNLTNELPFFVCCRRRLNSIFPLKTFQHYLVLRNVTAEHLLMINHPQEDLVRQCRRSPQA